MKIFDTDRYEEIWSTLSRNKARSFITAIGVFGAVTLLVVMLSVGYGFKDIIMDIGSGVSNVSMINVEKTSIPYKGNSKGRTWFPTFAQVSDLNDRVMGVKVAAYDIHAGNKEVVYGEKSTNNFQILGALPSSTEISPVDIVYGRYINELDVLRSRRVCVLSENSYQILFDEGVDPVGEQVLIGSSHFLVVGVTKPSSKSMFYNHYAITIPSSTAKKQYNIADRVWYFSLLADDNADIEQVQQDVKERLYALNEISPDDNKAISMFNMSDLFVLYNNLFLGIEILIWGVGLGTLLAGVVGVSNIMLIVVKERTQEIGIRRAIGATPCDIISQIMAESFVLTFITGVLALAFSVALLSIVSDAADEPRIMVTMNIAMISVGIVLVSSVLAGIIPASRAIRIKAVDAIREE
ncbi:MAG: ABC transporter permease [Rikenellaceae bacterium]